MYKDPKNPGREIVEVYNPPIRIKRTDNRAAKAIAYYKFKGTSGDFYYHLDVYEEYGKPYDYKGGNWSVDTCALLEEPKSNKDAARLLQSEANW